jgi:hypothetical protein
MGLERTAMALHNIRDIRELIDGDVRFALAFSGGGSSTGLGEN